MTNTDDTRGRINANADKAWICPKCGLKLENNVYEDSSNNKYCNSCGVKLPTENDYYLYSGENNRVTLSSEDSLNDGNCTYLFSDESSTSENGVKFKRIELESNNISPFNKNVKIHSIEDDGNFPLDEDDAFNWDEDYKDIDGYEAFIGQEANREDVIKSIVASQRNYDEIKRKIIEFDQIRGTKKPDVEKKSSSTKATTASRKGNKRIVILPIVLLIIILFTIAFMHLGIIDGSYMGIVNQDKSLIVLNKYIDSGQYQKAEKYAMMVQQRQPGEDQFVLQLVERISSISPTSAYQIVKSYYEGQPIEPDDNSISPIYELYELGKSQPVEPNLTPPVDTYINPLNVTLAFNDNRVGHSIYYTIDGSKPTKNSLLYTSPISLDKSATISILVTNANGIESDIYTYDYIVSSEYKENLLRLYNTAKDVYNNSVVGDEIGQVLYQSKKDLGKALNDVNNFLVSRNASADKAQEHYTELNNRLYAHNSSMLVNSDKTKLFNIINNANSLLDEINNDALASSVSGEVSTLRAKLGEAESIYRLRSAPQESIDAKVEEVSGAIHVLESNLKLIKLNERYEGYVGSYYTETKDGRFGKNIYIRIDKIQNGALWGEVRLHNLYSQSDFREVYVNVELAGVDIVDDKIDFTMVGNIKATSTDTLQEVIDQYSVMASLSLTEDSNSNLADSIQFNCKDIGGGEEWYGLAHRY